MFELWARRRPVDGKGFPYELISKFENEDHKYSAIDDLDRSIYKEAMVTDGNNAGILYRELEPVQVKKIGTIKRSS